MTTVTRRNTCGFGPTPTSEAEVARTRACRSIRLLPLVRQAEIRDSADFLRSSKVCLAPRTAGEPRERKHGHRGVRDIHSHRARGGALASRRPAAGLPAIQTPSNADSSDATGGECSGTSETPHQRIQPAPFPADFVTSRLGRRAVTDPGGGIRSPNAFVRVEHALPSPYRKATQANLPARHDASSHARQDSEDVSSVGAARPGKSRTGRSIPQAFTPTS